MPFVLRPAVLEPHYPLSRVWLDFEESFRTDNLVWGEEPRLWKQRVLAALARMCPDECETHADGYGSGPWLYDAVWSVGDPRTDKFLELFGVIQIAWPWNAHDWDEWIEHVQVRSNQLHGANCVARVMVLATPTFEGDRLAIFRAVDTADRCWRQYVTLAHDVLYIIISEPEEGKPVCTLRGLLFHIGALTPTLFGAWAAV